MKITVEQVEHVAKLARLKINDDEKERFAEQLSAILQYAEKLEELNTEGVEPTTHVLPLHSVMREDKVQESLPIEQVLHNAPEDEDGQFRVPAVLD